MTNEHQHTLVRRFIEDSFWAVCTDDACPFIEEIEDDADLVDQARQKAQQLAQARALLERASHPSKWKMVPGQPHVIEEINAFLHPEEASDAR